MKHNTYSSRANIETLEHRWHLAAATVNVSSFEPLAERDTRQAGIFVVTRRDSLESDLTVSLVTRGTARNGIDYGRIGKEVTIPAGQRSVAIPVRPVNNSTVSSYVTLTAETPAGYTSVSNVGVVYVVSNDNSFLPGVQTRDFLFPFTQGSAGTPTNNAGGGSTGTPSPGGGTSDGGTVVTSPTGGVTTIPTGSAIGIGALPGDTTASPATGVGAGTVQTVTFDPLTGLPITSTSTVGGTALPTPTGGVGTGTGTVTTIDPVTGRPVTSPIGNGVSGTTTGTSGSTTGVTGTTSGIGTGTAIGTGTVAGGIFGTGNDGLTIGTTTTGGVSRFPGGIYSGTGSFGTGSGTSFGTTPISNGLRAGVDSDSLFVS